MKADGIKEETLRNYYEKLNYHYDFFLRNENRMQELNNITIDGVPFDLVEDERLRNENLKMWELEELFNFSIYAYLISGMLKLSKDVMKIIEFSLVEYGYYSMNFFRVRQSKKRKKLFQFLIQNIYKLLNVDINDEIAINIIKESKALISDIKNSHVKNENRRIETFYKYISNYYNDYKEYNFDSDLKDVLNKIKEYNSNNYQYSELCYNIFLFTYGLFRFYYLTFIRNKDNLDVKYDFCFLSLAVNKTIFKKLSNMERFINKIVGGYIAKSEDIEKFLNWADDTFKYIHDYKSKEYDKELEDYWNELEEESLYQELDEDYVADDLEGYTLNFSDYKETGYDSKELSKQISEVNKNILENKSLTDNILQTATRIETKVDEIKEDINKASEYIKEIKTIINPILGSLDDESNEYNIIFSKFEKNIIQRIEEVVDNHTNLKSYKKYDELLQEVLTKENYKKISIGSKNFIITAKIMYDDLSNLDEGFDFSGICLLLTKALEKECKDRFYFGYISYMKEKYEYDFDKYPEWAITLRRKNNKMIKAILPAEQFTLGTVPFATGYKRNYDSNKYSLNSMIDYCSSSLYINSDRDYIKKSLCDIGKYVDEARIKYRNPAAHTAGMSLVNASDCFNYLLTIEKIFQKILSNMKN